MKVQTWVDGIEDREFVGVGARFGTKIASKEKNANRTSLTLSDPRDGCSAPKSKVWFLYLYTCTVIGLDSAIISSHAYIT